MKKLVDIFNKNSRTALITGGAGFLGLEHAYALSKNRYNIIITDLNLKDLKTAKKTLEKKISNRNVIFKKMDVTKESDVVKILNYIESEGFNVDILINNAANNPKLDNKSTLKNKDRLENLSINRWEKDLKISLTGSLICSKIFGSAMAKKKYGVIINIASDLSVIAPDQSIYQVKGLSENDQPVKPISYSVSKHGIIGLTKYLASYWGGKGVRVNAISPGGVFNYQDKKFVKKLINRIPMKRMASPNDLHEVIIFLCSDNNMYMTGQNIVIDGGRSII